MLILHTAKKSADLANSLIQTLKNKPLKNCFEKEIFLIQSSLLAPWLSQQFASHFNVWAHYKFLLSTSFFAAFSKKIDSDYESSSLESSSLLWQIETQLHHLDDSEFTPLKTYLQGDNIALKRYQLSVKITRLFDDYAHFRPELLNTWQDKSYQPQTAYEIWQWHLWRKLPDTLRAAILRRTFTTIINRLKNSPIGTFHYKLPERLSVFGFITLTLYELDYLAALSHHCDIHFYLQTTVSNIIEAQTIPTHSLIQNLAQQGHAFEQLLLQKLAFTLNPILPNPFPIDSNLQQLQHDLSTSSLVKKPIKKDGSLIINACHSRLRELECVKYQLLNCLEKYPELTWRDIGVLAPDITLYAPFIPAIFDTIPISLQSTPSHTIFSDFFKFLRLIKSRFEWTEVLELLESPIIFPSFELSESDLSYIKHWLKETEVRWGKSAQQKQSLELPAMTENTWQATMERLLMGYGVGDGGLFVDQVLPYHALEGASAKALGGLNDFMQLLFNASDFLSHPRTQGDWIKNLTPYIQALFSDHEEALKLYTLLDATQANCEEMPSQKIELTVIIQWLEQHLTETDTIQGLLRGKLNFCDISTAHGIPFKVTAMLGLDEGKFPSPDNRPAFDLLTIHPKLGDFSPRKDQRQQFLDGLLNTEKQLILSYVGQSHAQNETIPPSTVISELLEILKRDYQLDDLVIKHPLQAFSFRYFDRSTPYLNSYSVDDFETAIALSKESTPPQNWWPTDIDANENTVLELTTLQKFYKHPQRHFMQNKLGVYLEPLAPAIQTHEPFSLSKLETYQVNQDWVEHLLKQQDFSLKKLQAQGHWLSGVLGEVEFKQQQNEIVQFVTQIHALNLGEPLENKAIDLDVSKTRVTGKLYNLYQHGSLFYRYANLKGKDLILTWLHHCLINQLEPQETHLLSKDYALIFTTEHQSLETLENLVQIYYQGLQSPTILWVDIALEYVKQVHKLNTSTRAQKPALAIAVDKLKLSLETD